MEIKQKFIPLLDIPKEIQKMSRICVNSLLKFYFWKNWSDHDWLSS